MLRFLYFPQQGSSSNLVYSGREGVPYLMYRDINKLMNGEWSSFPWVTSDRIRNEIKNEESFYENRLMIPSPYILPAYGKKQNG